MKNQVILGDCLEVMKDIPDKSIDMILCDLPYGTTACKWDTIIPFEPLWEQYKRIIKDNGAIVLTASQPFTSALVMSNVKMFKYEWIWDKVNRYTGYASCKYAPLKRHENVLVFGGKKFNPQMTTGKPYKKTGDYSSKITGQGKIKKVGENTGTRYPHTVLSFNGDDKKNGFLHPTQKPVALFEYLIKTYTNEGDLVLDNCAGSGTTGVACKNLNRNFILIEKEQEYIDIINERLSTPISLD
jgi:site-specific DNA-methyltransferase (adenine-specific)